MVRSQSWTRFARDVEGVYTDLGRRPLTLCKLAQILRELAALEDSNGQKMIRSAADLTTRVIARWRALYDPVRSPVTQAGLLSYIRAIANYAVSAARSRRSMAPLICCTAARITPRFLAIALEPSPER